MARSRIAFHSQGSSSCSRVWGKSLIRASTSASQACGSISFILAVYAERRTMPSDAVLGGRERSGHASGVIFRSSVARHSQRRSKRVKERKKLVVRSEPSGCFAFVRAELGQRSFLQSEMGVQIDLGCLD